jgi:hypothetical protein
MSEGGKAIREGSRGVNGRVRKGGKGKNLGSSGKISATLAFGRDFFLAFFAKAGNLISGNPVCLV